ncbi:hypothetical protein D0Z06_24600 [Geodermatophilus marinus]|nr:hypothetical protein D0Z06_24600 [Geodermatophilus sp. LHW52908]
MDPFPGPGHRRCRGRAAGGRPAPGTGRGADGAGRRRRGRRGGPWAELALCPAAVPPPVIRWGHCRVQAAGRRSRMASRSAGVVAAQIP